MHVELLLFVAAVWPQILKKEYYKKYKNRPSVTKGCKAKQAEVQIPSTSTSNS